MLGPSRHARGFFNPSFEVGLGGGLGGGGGRRGDAKGRARGLDIRRQ